MTFPARLLTGSLLCLLFAWGAPLAAAPNNSPEQVTDESDEDEVDWPEDAEEDEVDWPEDAEEAEEDEGPGDADDDGETAEIPLPQAPRASVDATSPVAMALRELLSVPHTVRQDNELTVQYPLKGSVEVEDFEFRGFDKFEVCHAWRGNGAYSERMLGLECGASSQRVARMRHTVALEDEFQVDMQLWINAATSRSKLVFLFGDKVGVSWGQQIAKVSKRGSVKPLAGTVDRDAFRGERLVRIKLRARDNVLTVTCDGRRTAERAFRPGELKGHFGMLIKGVRVQLMELRIQGLVDAKKL